MDQVNNRLSVLEGIVEQTDGHDKNIITALNGLRRDLDRLAAQAGKHFAPGTKGTGLPQLAERAFLVANDAIVSGLLSVIDERDAEFKKLKSGFTALSAEMSGSVAQLRAVANDSAELASNRLCKAARYFSSDNGSIKI